MSIFVVESDSIEFEELTKTLEEFVDLEFFDNEKDLLSRLSEEGDAVLLNLDDEIKKKDKLIKKIKKSFDDLPLFVLCNNLELKKMTKHQSSKLGADIYIQTPVQKIILLDQLGEYFEIESNENVPDANLAKIEEDLKPSSVGTQTNISSQKLDDLMSGVFVEDYANKETEKNSEKLDEIPAMEDEVELSLDEADDGLSLDEADDGLSLDEADDELSFGDAGDEPNINTDDGLLIDEKISEDDSFEFESSTDNTNENVQGLEADNFQNDQTEEDEVVFPDEDDLEFPEPTSTNISSDVALSNLKVEESENIELDEGLNLDLSDGENDLSLSDGDDLPESADFSSAGEIDLESNDIVSVDEEPGEDGLDLSFDEPEKVVIDEEINSDSAVFNLEEEEALPDASQDLGMDFGLDESLDLSENTSDSISTDLDENIIVDDSVEDNEITRPISKDELEDIGLDLFSENADEQAANELPEPPNIDSFENDDLIFASDNNATSNDDTGTIQGLAIDNFDENNDEENIDDILSAANDEDTAAVNLNENDLSDLAVSDIEENNDDLTQAFSAERLEIPSDNDESSEDATRVFSREDIPSVDETKVVSRSEVSEAKIEDHKEYVRSHDDELSRLGETIKMLREDRDRWMEKVESIESEKDKSKNKIVTLQAEVDESRIELKILRKRYDKKVDELKYQLDFSEDKREALALKNTTLQQQVDELSRKNKVDFQRIRSREVELEERLEMLTADAEIQIKNRDHKILELKRRVDTLEFDIESSFAKEKQTVSSKNELENKMEKVIQTLRSTISHLEDDKGNEERLRRIKKNLDV